MPGIDPSTTGYKWVLGGRRALGGLQTELFTYWQGKFHYVNN
jgi:hypothetical protein